MSGFAIDELFHQHQSALRRFLQRLLRNEQLADDVAQEAWLKILRYAPREPVENSRAYVMTVGVNAVRDHIAREQTRSRYLGNEENGEELVCPEAGPEQWAEAGQRMQLLVAAVDALPPRCREVFLLSRFDGLGNSAIAERLGISRNMVEKHIIKAMLHCRAALRAGE